VSLVPPRVSIKDDHATVLVAVGYVQLVCRRINDESSRCIERIGYVAAAFLWGDMGAADLKYKLAVASHLQDVRPAVIANPHVSFVVEEKRVF
jgi:hypothetical protein